ncbi:CaiB/BaiF CoA transferase family protein [Bosea minatitlanensis]|uniref:CaiB/BaiF CoA transferase family protein n=1 Tax=Bosea minatitlanensis TaxID=128782 RepID=A0ABW0F2A5_9HYPH|nr:CoA transferase [Bosea minatitlanensis]MCT4495209.1 CoA transferase [Bosea minatitlanensis]
MQPDFLKGIRFADFTWAGAGPFSTKLFSDFGAEILKIEGVSRPDPVRVGGPFKDGVYGINRSGYFASRNTGKRSVAINLKNGQSRETLYDIIRQSDVISNNFGPGAMERLGFGYEDVKAIKPDIIYLAMPMYGEDGPLANLLGVGMTISAVTGLMWQTGYEGEGPIGPGTHFPDHAANPYHAAFAVMAALRYKRATGKGMKIDLSQVESTINCMGLAYVEHAVTGVERERLGNRSPHFAPHNIFRCAGEDEWCAITVLKDSQWAALCEVIGDRELASDPTLATAKGRLAQIERVEAAVAAWTAARDPVSVMQALQARGVPAGLVASCRYLMDEDPQLRHRGYWQTVDHPEIGEARFTSPPFLLDGERVSLKRPPLIGEHTEEVLAEVLGYAPERISALRAEGVLE